ncbi:MAG: hypothetical protein ACRDGD_05570 [Candidatus Limnocylindria bacterium]
MGHAVRDLDDRLLTHVLDRSEGLAQPGLELRRRIGPAARQADVEEAVGALSRVAGQSLDAIGQLEQARQSCSRSPRMIGLRSGTLVILARV